MVWIWDRHPHLILLFAICPQDANDNSPLFNKSVYPIEIFENITTGTAILQLSAQDKDLSINTKMQYYIVSGNSLERFFIDVFSGVLYVKSPIDRDPPRNEDSFLLTVIYLCLEVSHSGNLTFETINIWILYFIWAAVERKK